MRAIREPTDVVVKVDTHHDLRHRPATSCTATCPARHRRPHPRPTRAVGTVTEGRRRPVKGFSVGGTACLVPRHHQVRAVRVTASGSMPFRTGQTSAAIGWIFASTLIDGTQAESVRVPLRPTTSLYAVPANVHQRAGHLPSADSLPTGYEVGVLAGKVPTRRPPFGWSAGRRGGPVPAHS